MSILIFLLCLTLIAYLLALLALYIRDNPVELPVEWPTITVWVAARNEEQNILECLKSLDGLDYPKEKLQLLIGDDESEDRTAEIIKAFISDKPHFHYLFIDGKLGKAEKKANVLAQLAHASHGVYYLICDADIRVKRSWAKELVRHFDGTTGVVSGTTLVDDDGWFGRMQRMDWLYFMGLIKSAANLGIPCTAVGNNMAVSKEAYWATGGYENIDFSITEDFKLFREIIERDYGWKHLNNVKSTSHSAPVPEFRTLLNQRKRWLKGGRELPVYWKILLGLHASFDPLCLMLLFFHPVTSLLLLSGRIILQVLFLLRLFQRVGERAVISGLTLYPGYSAGIYLCIYIYYLLPGSKEWKARKY